MGRRTGFREVLAVREFRALWSAELLSVGGDQLARVGLAVLVYTRTSSAGWTALTYALTFLPALLGGVLLGGLADRFPRRELMVVVDVLRAAVAGLMAIPSLPIPVLLVLVFLLTLGGAPFKAAQQALLPTILTGDRYVAGLALRTVTSQTAQVAGFLGGGALLAVLDPHAALGLNAGTFLMSAAVLVLGVDHRPAARATHPARSTGAASLIWRDPYLRGLVALSWLVGVFVIPEGLAAPYAAGLSTAAAAVGLLMAAAPAGSIVGAWLVSRVPQHARPAMTTWFAVLAGVPLTACLLRPPLTVVVLLWAISGACATAYLVLAQAAFVLAVPDHSRGAASGLAGAGVLSSQGVAVLGAGLLADATSPVLAVATGGVAGVGLTGLLGVSWLRARSRQGRAPVGSSGRETDDIDHDEVLTSPSSSTSLAPPSQRTAAEHGNGSAVRAPKITSPSSSTSRTPPFMNAAAAHGDGKVDQAWEVTSPSSSSRTPPPTGTAAEHGNGNADPAPTITSPSSSTSRTPPSASAAVVNGNGNVDRGMVPRPPQPASLSTDGRSRLPTRWALWRQPARVLALLLAVEATAVGVTAYLAWHSHVDAADLTTLGIIVGLGLAMGELTRHVERVRRRFNDTPHVNLTSVWTFSALLVLPPALVPVVTGAMYLHLFWRSWYRVRSVHAYRLVFTASTVVLGAYSASAIRYLLAPAELPDWGQPVAVVAVVLAVLAYSGVNLGLVATAITLHARRLDVRRALGTAREAALEYATIALGAITALLISVHPAWALMVVPPLLVLHRSVLMRQLEEAASTDQKTGLANATAWTNMATAEIQRAARDKMQVGILMVDLDHFKAVNDAHGHLVGDRVLQAVADTLTTSARRYDVVGRWGGEEFVVLCPEVSADALRQIGERICERVRQLGVPVAEHGRGEVVDGLSVSVGTAVYPEFGPELQDVLLAADDALFVAKDSGRNQVQTIIAAIGDLAGPRSPSQGS
ncbi:MFS transporter [Actinophytocola sp.]|uniref:MFS transporter n=1 Tax=Actinophytocola sp. TaxID=1872138 RepID=UPI0025C618D4|nr:MFS transporter [Actinophytocola sp.]